MRPPGIEPGSCALQARAMTTSAKAALNLSNKIIIQQNHRIVNHRETQSLGSVDDCQQDTGLPPPVIARLCFSMVPLVRFELTLYGF